MFEILRGSKFFQNKKLVSILLNRGNSIIHLNREQGTGNREQGTGNREQGKAGLPPPGKPSGFQNRRKRSSAVFSFSRAVFFFHPPVKPSKNLPLGSFPLEFLRYV
ncbi:hypothetical protein F2A07_05585 [Akkermansia sp. BIOML-A61]|nr:hypothetical protein F2A23_06735 [Akkermansia sp. BIOML-A63]KAA3173250.1 hypothetical protein F2A07_05585 [Akkermansia sp. BIOML-A61]